jgi:aryl-alcohol dehydrogenase-like predicted oxidoreductase
MNYRLLGKSGLRVSEFCLGTMTFGEDWGWGSSKDDAKKIYDAFREAGGNFIDTANIYTNGTSESFLGEFLKGHRESAVLATSIPTRLQVQTQTQRAITARTWCKRLTRVSSGFRPTTSTYTGSTSGTRLLLLKK